MERGKEETVIVLDFLSHGYAFDRKPLHLRTSVVQAIGKNYFILLELVPKKDVHLLPHQEVYIGEGKRDKIHHIIGKLALNKLTATAKNELEYVVKDIVKKNERKFIEFYNNANPLSTRMHQLELLPGVGKRHMWEIIEARKERPFESFADLKQRVKLMPDPEKAIIRRILKELDGTEKHRMFVDV